MRARKLVVGAVVLALAGLLIMLIRPAPAVRRPPVLRVVSIEPAGVWDDRDVEMWLVTLSISNSENVVGFPENGLNVRESGKPIEVEVVDRWITLERESRLTVGCHLSASEEKRLFLLAPAGTVSCRIALQYAGSRLSMQGRQVKGRLLWLAERLSLFVRSRLSYKVWRWLGFNSYGPGSDWRQVTVELPLPRPSAPPYGLSTAR